MVLNNDKYLYALKVKLNFYKDILYMIEHTNGMYDITFIESMIGFAFPGSKFDNDFLEMLTLEIETSTKEVSLYTNADEETKRMVSNNQLEQKTKDVSDINNFNLALGAQKRLIENDYRTIDRMQSNPNYDHIFGLIDIRVKSIKEELKVRGR